MINRSFFILSGIFFLGTFAVAQQSVFTDSFPSGNSFTYKYVLNIPVGETFIKPSGGKEMNFIRARYPANLPSPRFSKDTTGRLIVTSLACGSHDSHRNYASFSSEASGNKTSYRFSNTSSIGKSQKMIWEIEPSSNALIQLDLNLGFGHSRIDLSGLSTQSLNVRTGASDVILTYQKPNAVEMENMHIQGGMSTIILRNVEFARARKVIIENAMGDTKIILGRQCPFSSHYSISVGAGSCSLLISDDVAARIIISENILSTIDLPANFVKRQDNVYVNRAYQENSDHVVTFNVDLGVGSLNVVNMNE